MHHEAAIVDAVQTQHGSALKENIQEITFKAVEELLDRVGIEKSEIGTMVSSSSDYWQGSNCSNSYYYDAAGDSVLGFNYSGIRILSEHYETVLVVGVTKRSEVPPVMGVKGVFGPGPGFQKIFKTIEKAVG